MKSHQHAYSFLFLLLLCSAGFSELPPELKFTAEQYDKAQKGIADSIAAQTKAARDAYLIILSTARKREEAAKRSEGVAGIDADIEAVKAGSLEGNIPEKLPADLKIYRDRFIADAKRAVASNERVRKHSTEQYLKYLSGLEAAAKGKNEGLLAAVLSEKKRVLDESEKAAPGGK